MLLFVVLLLHPLSAWAESSLTAGLVQQTLWFSNNTPTGGTTITVYTPVYNNSEQKIGGDVVFMKNDTVLGTARFELKPSESKLVSFLWTTDAGTHDISAHIENVVNVDSKETITISDSATHSVSIAVREPPPKPASLLALTDAAHTAQQIVAAATPIVTSNVKSLYDATEALREKAAEILKDDLVTQKSTEETGQVLGASTYVPANQTASAGNTQTSFDILRFFKQILFTIVNLRWLFYPTILLVLIGGLFLIGKALGNRRNSY